MKFTNVFCFLYQRSRYSVMLLSKSCLALAVTLVIIFTTSSVFAHVVHIDPGTYSDLWCVPEQSNFVIGPGDLDLPEGSYRIVLTGAYGHIDFDIDSSGNLVVDDPGQADGGAGTLVFKIGQIE
jgi:hypothetical protein